MSENEKALKHIFSALSDHFLNHSIVIWQISPSGEPSVGSGTCVEIGNRLFVATAAHNFKDLQNGGRVVLFSGRGSTLIRLKEVGHNYLSYGAPKTLDVAWVEINQDSAAQSNLLGIPLRSIAPYHSLDESYYSITGIPSERSKIDIENKQARVTLLPIIYYTHAASKPGVADADLFLNYPIGSVNTENQLVPTDDPYGMSGGGIWYTPPMDVSQVWSLAAYPLVGIVVSFLPQSRQICGLQMHRWLSLLHKDHPELSKHLEPLLEQKS